MESTGLDTLLSMRSLKELKYDVTVSPSDASAGKLDGDEKAAMFMGYAVIVAALTLIFVPIQSVNRDLLVGDGRLRVRDIQDGHDHVMTVERVGHTRPDARRAYMTVAMAVATTIPHSGCILWIVRGVTF